MLDKVNRIFRCHIFQLTQPILATFNRELGEGGLDVTLLWKVAKFMRSWTLPVPHYGHKHKVIILASWVDTHWTAVTERKCLAKKVVQGPPVCGSWWTYWHLATILSKIASLPSPSPSLSPSLSLSCYNEKGYNYNPVKENRCSCDYTMNGASQHTFDSSLTLALSPGSLLKHPGNEATLPLSSSPPFPHNDYGYKVSYNS